MNNGFQDPGHQAKKNRIWVTRNTWGKLLAPVPVSRGFLTCGAGTESPGQLRRLSELRTWRPGRWRQLKFTRQSSRKEKKKKTKTLKLETLCLLSHIWLFATPWTAACHGPLSIGFSRQEYWSGLPISSPGDLPNPRIKPKSFESPALTGGFFITGPCKEDPYTFISYAEVNSRNSYINLGI